MQGQTLWEKFLLWVREGNTFDSTYIYQRPAGFQASIDASVQQFQSSLTADITSTVATYDEAGNETGSVKVPSTSHTDISDIVNGGFGVGLSYGRLGFGLGVFSWPKSHKNSILNLNFGYHGNKWGINLGINGLEQHANNTTTIGTEGTENYHTTQYLSGTPWKVLRLSADAYWIINRDRFSYTSAYKCDMAQRQSVGSVLICASLVDFIIDGKEDAVLSSISDINGYSAFINSVGAGYSYNIVFKHHDPTGPLNEGLFNLTLNLTLMPMLTYSSTIFAKPQSGDLIAISSTVTPNLCGNAALGMYVGQWFFSLQYYHSVYYFSSRQGITAADLEMENANFDTMRLRGLMQDWKLTTLVVFNF